MSRYMISEAARMVDVEAHVLRYWEGELEMDIARNEMGHRYYTRENIECFRRVHEMKENGYGLKAIKMLLQNQKTDSLQENKTVIQEDEQNREENLRTLKKEKEDEARYQRFDELLRLRQSKNRRLCSQKQR